MEVTIIIALVLYALAIIMAIKLIKNVLVAVGTVVMVSLLLMAGTGLFIYNEVDEIQQRFPVSNNLFLLKEGDDVLSGIVLLPTSEGDMQNNMRFLDNETVSSLSSLKGEDEDALFDVVKTSDFLDESEVEEAGFNDDTYKIFFFDLDVIEDSPVESIDISALVGDMQSAMMFEPIPRESSVEMIRSDDPWAIVREYISGDALLPDTEEIESSLEEMGMEVMNDTENNMSETVEDLEDDVVTSIRTGLTEQFGTDDVGSLIFLLNMVSLYEQEGKDGLMYLYEQYSDKNIYVREESIIFDMLRLSPDSLVNAVISETQSAAGMVGDELSDRVPEDDVPQNIDEDVADPETVNGTEEDVEPVDPSEMDLSDEEIDQLADDLGVDPEEIEDMVEQDE